MAYDRESLVISWIFAVVDTEEVAITSAKITGAAFDAVAALGAADTRASGLTCSSLYADFMTTSGILWGTYSRLTDVKMAAVGTDGLYLTDAVIYTDSTPAAGITEQVVPQSSVVGSLRTLTTLGKANYGRMYLPHTKLEMATGKASANSAVTASVVAGFKVFLNAINAEFNVGPEPGLLSIMSSEGTGTTKPVSRCAIGSVTDTQRRRRNRITELYSFLTL